MADGQHAMKRDGWAIRRLPQPRPPEGFGEDLDLVEAEVQEGAVEPEGAVGNEEV